MLMLIIYGLYDIRNLLTLDVVKTMRAVSLVHAQTTVTQYMEHHVYYSIEVLRV